MFLISGHKRLTTAVYTLKQITACNSVLSHLSRSTPRSQTQRWNLFLRIKRQGKRVTRTVSQSEECLPSARELLCFCREDRLSSPLRRRKVDVIWLQYSIWFILTYVNANKTKNKESSWFSMLCCVRYLYNDSLHCHLEKDTYKTVKCSSEKTEFQFQILNMKLWFLIFNITWKKQFKWRQTDGFFGGVVVNFGSAVKQPVSL